MVGRWGSPPRGPWGLTGAQSLLQQQHLVTERLDPIAPAPQLRHLLGLQLFRGHRQHCSDPGPSLTGPLLQPLQAPSQLANLPPQGTLIRSSLTNGHVEDAGTGRGLWGPLRASAPIQAQNQAVRTATGETARRIEAAMRAESDAGSAFIHIHVTVLPTPARGALAVVRPNADASVLAGLGADG